MKITREHAKTMSTVELELFVGGELSAAHRLRGLTTPEYLDALNAVRELADRALENERKKAG